jgi:hypothetical protein
MTPNGPPFPASSNGPPFPAGPSKIEILTALLAENAALKAAGVNRQDPSTWGRVHVKTIDEHIAALRCTSGVGWPD